MLTNILFERSRHAPKKLFKVNVRQTAKSRAETKGAVKHGRFDSHVSIIFIGPESDHWLCLSLTNSLTD